MSGQVFYQGDQEVRSRWIALITPRLSPCIGSPDSLLNSRLGGALRREQVVGHDEAHEDDDDGQDPKELLPAGTLPAGLQGVCKALNLMRRLSSRELGLLSRTPHFQGLWT